MSQDHTNMKVSTSGQTLDELRQEYNELSQRWRNICEKKLPISTFLKQEVHSLSKMVNDKEMHLAYNNGMDGKELQNASQTGSFAQTVTTSQPAQSHAEEVKDPLHSDNSAPSRSKQ